MAKFLETGLLVLAMLFFGSYNTIVTKLFYQTSCPTLPSGSGEYHLFNKPWFTNLMMFAGEVSLLIPFTMRYMARNSKRKEMGKPLLLEDLPKAPNYVFAIPASCDVLATGISSVAMMYLDAAVWQMMRGAVIIFSAILSVTFLRRMLHVYHWVGVLLTVVGLFFIGVAAILGEAQTSEKDAKEARLGIILVIVAQVFSAFQFVFEEYLLKGYSCSSLQTVGMEGVWGTAYMMIILAVMAHIPGSDHGVYESFPDGVYMIGGSHMMQLLGGSYMLSIALYNYMGMQLCRKLSAVTRCLVDCMRTVTVWAFQLFLYYCVSDQFGTPWTKYSIFQLVGFGFLVLGTFIYNGIIRIPGMDYRRLDLDLPQKVMQATWSPTVQRASIFGWGPKYGPQSPHSASSIPNSPLPFPFGSPPAGGAAQGGPGGFTEVILEGIDTDEEEQ